MVGGIGGLSFWRGSVDESCLGWWMGFAVKFFYAVEGVVFLFWMNLDRFSVMGSGGLRMEGFVVERH